ncbi:hypothetical protein MASR2M78_34510 [Treponema sp.]
MNHFKSVQASRRPVLLGFLILFASFQALAQNSPRLILVEGGTFIQGSMEAPYSATERAHETSLSSFLLAETETTQDLWNSVMKGNPSKFRGSDKPVENVSWLDAVRFCNALSEAEGLQVAYTISGSNVSWDRNASGYRLPTEAEWEYAARGGNLGTSPDQTLSRAPYSGGTDALELGWFDRNSGKSTQSVAKKKPNELGFYDMSGNVWEWCWDWYGSYPKESVKDPEGAERGTGQKVMRGGAWFTPVNLLRVTYRYWNTPTFKVNSVGFRLARNIDTLALGFELDFFASLSIPASEAKPNTH